jgi:hypothetical protein
MPECAARLFVRPFVRSFYPGETSGDRRVPEQNLALVGVLGTRGSRVNVAGPPPPRGGGGRTLPSSALSTLRITGWSGRTDASSTCPPRRDARA